MNLVFLFTCSLYVPSTTAWLPRSIAGSVPTRLGDPSITKLKSSLHVESNSLGGVPSFESWFQRVEGTNAKEGLSHTAFGNLRGLTYASYGSDIITIPKSIVLDSDFTQPDWDAQLASKLWAECKKGPSSMISGYVDLLTNSQWTAADLPSMPPSTAPDALRHWTEGQLKVLKENPAGEKLLDLMQQQEQIWKSKFATAGSDISWEQFQWAMEVVHSRAFCGDFGVNSGIPKAVLLSLPVLAGIVGYCYSVVLHGQNDIVLALLSLVAGIPVVLSALTKDSQVAVLLPLIDSANHQEDADSTINYSQVGESFNLSVGETCIVETNGEKQLFISYGEKKDTELLLNYGFLQGVDVSDSCSDVRRQKLAEKFLSRQK
ncbi:unnamed protein product [Cylindrotheca closterium]|uniref:SET domain-containing protein n=1 Tax=Cylindrotheca closterium TaxID=2856 RepID=A0AAD2FZR3_9STRA|nr:unnamed protein product [Cylindrotheca closterium]